MPERTPRFTPEQRRAIGERRRRANARARYGEDYASQGYRDEPEAGRAFLRDMEQRLQNGPFNPRSYLQQWRNGVLYLRPTARQTGRLEGGNWAAGEWRPASEVLSPGHYAALQRTTTGAQGQARRAWAAANPGGGYDDWLAYRFAQGLPRDPATGLRRLRSGEYRDEQGHIPATVPPPAVSGLSGASALAAPAVAQSAPGTLGNLVESGYQGPDLGDADQWGRRRRRLTF